MRSRRFEGPPKGAHIRDERSAELVRAGGHGLTTELAIGSSSARSGCSQEEDGSGSPLKAAVAANPMTSVTKLLFIDRWRESCVVSTDASSRHVAAFEVEPPIRSPTPGDLSWRGIVSIAKQMHLRPANDVRCAIPNQVIRRSRSPANSHWPFLRS